MRSERWLRDTPNWLEVETDSALGWGGVDDERGDLTLERSLRANPKHTNTRRTRARLIGNTRLRLRSALNGVEVFFLSSVIASDGSHLFPRLRGCKI